MAYTLHTNKKQGNQLPKQDDHIARHPTELKPFLLEFLKWTLPEYGQNHYSKKGVSVKNQSRVANIVDPDETAQYELSHQDLLCLQNNFWVSRTERVYEISDRTRNVSQQHP